MRNIFNAGLGFAALVLVAPVASLGAKDRTAAAPVNGKSIVMAVRTEASAEAVAADQAIADHLRGGGFNVTLIDTSDASLKDRPADLILISSSVSGKELAGLFRHSQIPVITWEPAILPYMGMSGKRENVDYGSDDEERSLWLVNAPHAIAGGLPAGHINVYSKNVVMGWGKPGLGASIIATLPGEPGRAAAFAYERGSTMDYESIAPERRVFLFLDNGTFLTLNPAGRRMFDAAISWALRRDRQQ